MLNDKIKVAMLSAEVAPFAQTGGLGDVVGSLPKALARANCDIRIIMPLYGSINRRKYKIKKIITGITICVSGRKRKINIWASFLPGSRVRVYFIEAPYYFGSQKIYTVTGNAERFLFFSLASLHTLPNIGFQPDIIQCHDFHTALTIDLLKAMSISYFKDTKTVFTIHNLNYQGRTGIEVLSTGGLSRDALRSLVIDARDGDINFMVQGIINADAVNTVSPTYAREIRLKNYGAGIAKVIRRNKRKIIGILNGIDTEFFDPGSDELIKQKYNFKTLNKKTANKLYLQKLLRLPIDGQIPVIGFISRLVWQKGIDLITEELVRGANAQFIFLGAGHAEYERYLKNLANKFPEKVRANIKFDVKQAQAIYAGADIMLIPSRFEPCGLVQMIAMRYGTIPVVRRTGGLSDTVRDLKIDNKSWLKFLISPFRPRSEASNFPAYRAKALAGRQFSNKSKIIGTGFTFTKLESQAILETLRQALNIYYNHPKIWRQLQINGMRQDFSWSHSALEYLKLYKKLLE